MHDVGWILPKHAVMIIYMKELLNGIIFTLIMFTPTALQQDEPG